jgi:predicted dehydrogenase
LKDEGLIDEIVVCDINEKALMEIKKRDGFEIAKDWNSLLQDQDLDMVSIITPSPSHYEISKKFMEAGKDVLVEKPMAMTVEECDDLIKVSQETGSGLMVGHIFRFHPGVLELRNRIERGEFGEILNIKIRRQTLISPRKDMGVMLALGIHEVDLTCFLLNDKTPDKIFADMNSYYTNNEEMALIIQKFGKTTAYSIESWIDPSEGKLRDLYLIGTQGSAKLNFSIPNKINLINSYLKPRNNSKNTTYEVVNGGDFEVVIDYKEPLLEELRHFVLESKNKKKYQANAAIGRRAVYLILKAIESNKLNKFLEL